MQSVRFNNLIRGSFRLRKFRSRRYLRALRERPLVEGNVVRVGDLLEIVSGRDQQTDELLKLPLAPAPREGVEQTWTWADLIQHLELRGSHSSNLRWQGGSKCTYVAESQST